MATPEPAVAPHIIAASADVFERVCLAQNMAYFDWFPETGEVRSSEEMRVLFGFRLEGWTSQTTQEVVHPDDLPGFKRDLTALLKGLGSGGDLRFRVRIQGGSYRWFRWQMLFERNAAGRAIRVTIAATDITDAVEREAENRALLARQAASIEGLEAITACERAGIALNGGDHRLDRRPAAGLRTDPSPRPGTLQCRGGRALRVRRPPDAHPRLARLRPGGSGAA